MTYNIEIRSTMPPDSSTTDWAAIESLYRDAFPNEDLVPFVWDLLLQSASPTVSLAGLIDTAIVCHVIFTPCSVTGPNADGTDMKVLLLGPLAVASAWQNKGLGSTIVKSSLQQLQRCGIDRVCVLGDPAYYRRFGFLPETDMAPPYALPTEWQNAWQSVNLSGNKQHCRSRLQPPRPWQRPELWLP